MDELIAQLMERWRVEGVAPNPGASEAELSVFETVERVRLPNDLRRFLQAANGIPFSELDGLARLRPIVEYFRIVDRIPAPSTSGVDPDDLRRWYCFGDYNIEASFWGVRLCDDPAAIASVRVFWSDGDGYEIASSFRAFLAEYLSKGPDSMF